MKKPLFIVFEGIEGAGKTTQAKLLYDYLITQGHKAVLTREPGGTSLGKKIREILLSDTDEIFPSKAELFLYEADRNIHVHNIIKPSLENGITVICDRYIYSTLAYQGYARGLDINLIKNLNDIATDGVYPDIVFLIDIPVELSLKRLGNSKDRIEKESLEFHKKLREGFLKIAQENKDRFFVIDGTKSQDEIFRKVIEVLEERAL
jgi:dTMP kinase